MKKHLHTSLLTISLLMGSFLSKSQCVWEPMVTDNFEYTTAITGIMPGMTVHNTPQSFAVHTGAKSAYLNFTACNGGAGACAGSKVFERIIPICPDLPTRMNIWFTTSFTNVQCDIMIVISDANGQTLDSTASLTPPFAPAWTNFISSTITPTTASVTVTIYTNIEGSPSGNDLSMDDFTLEQCVNTHSSTVTGICNNSTSTDLYNSIPNAPVNTGTWTGPSVLTNGYQGTFTNGVNTGGQYIYSSSPYGTAPECPTRRDTIIAFPAVAPVVNLGNDTTLCTNQSIILTTGTSGGNNYSWSNGATTPVIGVPAPGGTGSTVSYSVTVTSTLGCADQDTITIQYIVCSGLTDLSATGVQIYPNPADEQLQIKIQESKYLSNELQIIDLTGKTILSRILVQPFTVLDLLQFQAGLYQVIYIGDGIQRGTATLVITH